MGCQFTDSESPGPADLMEEAVGFWMVGFLMVLESFFFEKSGDTSQDVQEDQVDEEDELYTQVQGNFLQLPAVVTWKNP